MVERQILHSHYSPYSEIYIKLYIATLGHAYCMDISFSLLSSRIAAIATRTAKTERTDGRTRRKASS